MDDGDNYEVYLRVSDGGQDPHLYMTEHWFPDRPAVETVKALLDEAVRDYDVLFPAVDAEDFSVEVRRLRPRDRHVQGDGRAVTS